MNSILRNPNISEMKQAIENNLYDFWKACSRIDLETVTYTENKYFYKFSAGIPFFMVNGIVDTKIPPKIAEETIIDLINSFKNEKLPFHWTIGPLSKPSNLNELLSRKKPSLILTLPGLALNLDELSQDIGNLQKITISKVQDSGTFKVWTEVMLNAFELPVDLLLDFYINSLSSVFFGENSRANAFIGYYDGKPVATSIGFYGSGVIGLYGIATIKEERGKRIGSAVTRAPLIEAKKLGYKLGVLHSTEMGLNLYKYLGFKEYVPIKRYIWNF